MNDHVIVHEKESRDAIGALEAVKAIDETWADSRGWRTRSTRSWPASAYGFVTRSSGSSRPQGPSDRHRLGRHDLRTPEQGPAYKGLYEVSGREAPDEHALAPRLLPPLRSRSRIATLPRTRRAKTRRDPALEKLHLSARQLLEVELQRNRALPGAARLAEFDRFQLYRQWDGHVLDVESDAFRASISIPKREQRDLRTEATFPLALVREEDRSLVLSGATFYYCIGRFLHEGRSIPSSILWFRRLLESQNSDEQALDYGAERVERITWTQ